MDKYDEEFHLRLAQFEALPKGTPLRVNLAFIRANGSSTLADNIEKDNDYLVLLEQVLTHMPFPISTISLTNNCRFLFLPKELLLPGEEDDHA